MTNALDKATQSFNEGKLRDALREYQAVVEVDPQNALAFQGLGHTYCKLKQYDEAIIAYRKALELDSGLATSHTNLGAIYGLRRQFADSEKEFRQAIALDPRSAEAHRNLGILLTIQGQLEEAETMVRRAIELDPTQATPYCDLFEIYLRKKRFADAKEVMRQAFQASPTANTVRQAIAAMARTYPQQIAYVFLLLLFFITLNVQPAIGLMIGLGLAIRGVLESIASFQSGTRKQAVIIGVLAFLLLGIAILVYWTSVRR